ncbi:putative transcription factor B3-Domain family [Helianthus anomalus]
MALPSHATTKLWGVYKAPTNVLIETHDGRKFTVYISEAKGIFFLFNGWSDVITHLGIKSGSFVIFTPLDSTTFKLTYFVNGVSSICFCSSMVSTASHLTVRLVFNICIFSYFFIIFILFHNCLQVLCFFFNFFFHSYR